MSQSWKVALASAVLLHLSGCADDPPAREAPLGTSTATVTSGCSSALTTTTAFKHGLPASNSNLPDFGVIFHEALTQTCADDAALGLREKIRLWFQAYGCDASQPNFNPLACGRLPDTVIDPSGAHGVLPFQGWLDGTEVQLIMATALSLGGKGRLTSELDRYVTAVGTVYDFHEDAACGVSPWQISGNACMDDHTVAASGLGWLAAYEAKRGRFGTTYQRAVQGALAQIAAAFSTSDSICIYNPIAFDPTGSCNGSPGDLDPSLGNGTGVFSLNHGQVNNIPYGLGLLTSVASGLIGLEEAGQLYQAPSEVTLVAQGLLREAQSHLSMGCVNPAYGSCTWSSDCGQGSLVLGGGLYCGDQNPNNVPAWYPVNNLYERWFGGIPSGYPFYQWTPGVLDMGRQAIYNTIANTWVYPWARSSLLSGKIDDFAPRGYLDGIDGQGCATGWACDPDAPSSAATVELRVDGSTRFTTPANLASDATINGQCNGGSAHRFRYCLPAWTAGHSITAYGDDSVPGAPAALLPGWTCGASAPACTWTAVNNYQPRGNLDSIDANGCAIGWACDPDAPNTSIQVQFYANGAYLAQAIASAGSEGSVNSQCGGGIAHRFSTCLPATSAGQRITAVGIDTVSGTATLPGWQCPQNPACVWPRANTYPPRGYLDGITADGYLWGWACDPDAPTATIPVQIYANGTLVATVTASDGSEPEVNQSCGGGGLHRFHASLPAFTRGEQILTYGVDTVGGIADLPGWQCAAHPACTW